jgi:hypothetical protein
MLLIVISFKQLNTKHVLCDSLISSFQISPRYRFEINFTPVPLPTKDKS